MLIAVSALLKAGAERLFRRLGLLWCQRLWIDTVTASTIA